MIGPPHAGIGRAKAAEAARAKKGREAQVIDPNVLSPTLLTIGTTKDTEVDQPKGKLRNREQAVYGPSN